jgi:hypothetical protein
MTADERRSLERLEKRLFGEDGEAGAIGTIRAEMHTGFTGLGVRVSRLETAHEVEETRKSDRRQAVDRIAAERRWRIGLAGGIATSLVLNLVGLLFAK